MYADRHAGSARFNAGGLAAAVGVNAAVVVALMFAAPHYPGKEPDRPFGGVMVELDPLPEPPPPPPEAKIRTAPRPAAPVDAPEPIVATATDDTGIVTSIDPGPLPGGDVLGRESGTGTGAVVDPPAPPPLIVGPVLDPRYAGDLQPAYPPAERRMGHEGRATVRVLIGTDGRVRQVERVSATSDAFFRATAEQARRRWRFKPGTRDGVPQEAWRVMTVTFVLSE